jgi:hypothetical protein
VLKYSVVHGLAFLTFGVAAAGLFALADRDRHALFFVFMIVLLSHRIIYNIHPGERGVRWARFGGGTVLDRDYAEGLRLLFPWDDMYIYNVRIQEAHETIQLLAYQAAGGGFRGS